MKKNKKLNLKQLNQASGGYAQGANSVSLSGFVCKGSQAECAQGEGWYLTSPKLSGGNSNDSLVVQASGDGGKNYIIGASNGSVTGKVIS